MRRFLTGFYARISLLFLVLLLAMGTVQVLLTIRIADLRQVEVDQLVNWDLARDMAAEIEPQLGSPADPGDIGSIIHYMMVLNPTVEIYLLDAQGRIRAFFAEPGKEVRAGRVALEPIREFLAPGARRRIPIYGEDPRQPGTRKHFSAAALTFGDGSPGYLYIVLRSSGYDMAASGLRERYLAAALTRGLVLAVVFVGVVGLALFALLTRRLQAVARSVRAFEGGDYARRVKVTGGDEIGDLGRAFNSMAGTITASMEKLRQTDRLRRELVANVSHDLRSPLTSIQGYVETLLMKQESLEGAQLRKYLKIILAEATRLNRLVHELFELSKLDARQVAPRIEGFSLTELIQDVIVTYAPRARQQGIRLSAELPERLVPVLGDIHLIERVLSNLLDNALAFTPAGGVVRLELEELDGRVRVSVVDSGQGIAREDLPFIFERFYTSDKSRSRLRGGSGLGLAIAQKILELHGGGMEVESEPDRGSAFRFELPAEG